MKELLKYYNEYKKECEKLWREETERVKAINEQKLKNNEPGFEFPKKTLLNTPSFEGFMDYLSYVIK